MAYNAYGVLVNPDGSPTRVPGVLDAPTTTVSPAPSPLAPSSTNIISSQNQAPVAPLNFQTPAPTPTPDVTKLDSTLYDLTPQETKAQGLTENLQELNLGLSGESAFKREQEQAQGIPELQKTQNDLSVRLKALQNEALAIPLQFQDYAPKSGIAQVFVDQKKTESLRANAIQALGVSSLLEASRGNLSTALDMVERQVKTKYDPLRADIEAKTKNLELLLASPSYTRAEKERARVQLDIQKSDKAKIERVEQKYKDGSKEILKYSDVANPVILKEMTDAVESDAGSLGVAQIANKYGLKTAKQQQKQTVKPPTAAQQTLSGYAARLEQANPILKNFENIISGMSYLKFKLKSLLPSAFQGSDFQQYNQAAKNFINAVLRRESGAAISASEFKNAQEQYLPIAGDSPATLRQKEQNRNLVFQNFRRGSGGAFSSVEDLLNGNNSQPEQQEVFVTPDGVEYVKGEDGLYYQK